ncbi:unnamed protein product [Eretmochelys imbricata]
MKKRQKQETRLLLPRNPCPNFSHLLSSHPTSTSTTVHVPASSLRDSKGCRDSSSSNAAFKPAPTCSATRGTIPFCLHYRQERQILPPTEGRTRRRERTLEDRGSNNNLKENQNYTYRLEKDRDTTRKKTENGLQTDEIWQLQQSTACQDKAAPV